MCPLSSHPEWQQTWPSRLSIVLPFRKNCDLVARTLRKSLDLNHEVQGHYLLWLQQIRFLKLAGSLSCVVPTSERFADCGHACTFR